MHEPQVVDHREAHGALARKAPSCLHVEPLAPLPVEVEDRPLLADLRQQHDPAVVEGGLGTEEVVAVRVVQLEEEVHLVDGLLDSIVSRNAEERLACAPEPVVLPEVHRALATLAQQLLLDEMGGQDVGDALGAHCRARHVHRHDVPVRVHCLLLRVVLGRRELAVRANDDVQQLHEAHHVHGLAPLGRGRLVAALRERRWEDVRDHPEEGFAEDLELVVC
mmetsp:Transcript_37128/g.87890  ORF Transcript_37128/g.87890 Transcript_37128/m.87890 type:complete len:221 (-) Transcript_37128:158-820(-)